MGQACHLKTTGSPSRGLERGWVSFQGCCWCWMGQSQEMDEASSGGSKELGTELPEAKPSGISGRKAFPERQRKTFNPLVSTVEQTAASEVGRALARWRKEIPDTTVLLTHQHQGK